MQGRILASQKFCLALYSISAIVMPKLRNLLEHFGLLGWVGVNLPTRLSLDAIRDPTLLRSRPSWCKVWVAPTSRFRRRPDTVCPSWLPWNHILWHCMTKVTSIKNADYRSLYFQQREWLFKPRRWKSVVFRCLVSNFTWRVSSFRWRVPKLRCRVSYLRWRVCNMRCRVSDPAGPGWI